MALLTGILMIGTLFAFVALLFRRTKQNLITFIVALVLLLIAAAITGSAQYTSLTAELERQAQEMQSQLPKKMNETVTANNVAVSGTTVIYDMSLAADVDESQLNTQSLKDPMVGTLCLNQDSRAILDAGATFRYDYTHSGSGSVYKVAITKYDC